MSEFMGHAYLPYDLDEFMVMQLQCPIVIKVSHCLPLVFVFICCDSVMVCGTDRGPHFE